MSDRTAPPVDLSASRPSSKALLFWVLILATVIVSLLQAPAIIRAAQQEPAKPSSPSLPMCPPEDQWPELSTMGNLYPNGCLMVWRHKGA